MSSPGGDDELVEYVVEFGEEIPYRRGGCPSCGHAVTMSAGTCGNCGEPCTPAEQG